MKKSRFIHVTTAAVSAIIITGCSGGSGGLSIDSLKQAIPGQQACAPRLDSAAPKEKVIYINGIPVDVTETYNELKATFDKTVEELSGIKSPKIPNSPQDTCEADKRLEYARNVVNMAAEKANESYAALLKSYGLEDEATKYLANLHKKAMDYSEEEQKEMHESVQANNNVMASKNLQSEGKIKEAVAKFKPAVSYFGLATGWYKELIGFGEDNMKWSVSNYSELDEALPAVSGATKIILAMQQVFIRPLTKYRYDPEVIKQSQQENQELAEKEAEEAKGSGVTPSNLDSFK